MAKHSTRASNTEREEETDLTGFIKEENKSNGFGGVPEALKFEVLRGRLQSGLHIFCKNKRLRWGIITLLVLVPMAKFAYLLLPEYGFGEYFINIGSIQNPNTIEGVENSWFHESFRFYFWIIGELLAPLILICGMFLLFPKNYYPAYLAIVPFGYYLTLLIYRMFFVNNDINFRDGFTISVTLTYMLFGIILFVISDKIIIDKNSKHHAVEARIKGIINMPGVKWSEKEELLRNEIAIAIKDENELITRESA